MPTQTNTRISASSLGYFLDFELWQNAIRLLNFQIAQKQKNRHYNTLSMFYYERLGPVVNALSTEDYFNDKVASNLFYGLGREFVVFPYNIPKPGLGLRSYKFFSYPLRAVYYTVGLYLLRLSQDFLKEYVATRKSIHAYYGAGLVFEQNTLAVSPQTTYFKQYYKAFRRQIRKEAGGDTSGRVIIKLDIENYFDEISIPILLRFLNAYIKPSDQAALHFDATTQEQLKSFFGFLSDGSRGIPQADNDVLSSFIGYLYMVFGDLLLDDLLRQEPFASGLKRNTFQITATASRNGRVGWGQ